MNSTVGCLFRFFLFLLVLLLAPAHAQVTNPQGYRFDLTAPPPPSAFTARRTATGATLERVTRYGRVWLKATVAPGAENRQAWTTPVGKTEFNWTACFEHNETELNYWNQCLLAERSSVSRAVGVCVGFDGGQRLRSIKFDTSTWTGGQITDGGMWYWTQEPCVSIVVAANTITLRVGASPLSLRDYVTETLSTYLGGSPDRIGFYMDKINVVPPNDLLAFFHWRVE